MSYLIAIVLGILAGGVVNALSDDLPRRRNPRLPHYPDDIPRPLTAWLGLTAFLFGQRTSPGGATLGWRYPLTEIMTAGLMVMAFAAREQRSDVSDLQFLFWLVYMVIFALIIVIDVEHRLILFVVIIPSVVITLVDALIAPPPTLVDALIGGVGAFGFFFLLYNGGFLFTYVMGKLRGQEIKEVAFGYGDVMLFGVSGVMLGWKVAIFAMIITIFLGGFGAIAYLVSRRLVGKRYSAFSPIPYGPYIVIGTLLLLLYPVQMIAWLMPGIR
jgi:prepilin signal peptidase PulO-like enzyme (type II secretory pathway)